MNPSKVFLPQIIELPQVFSLKKFISSFRKYNKLLDANTGDILIGNVNTKEMRDQEQDGQVPPSHAEVRGGAEADPDPQRQSSEVVDNIHMFSEIVSIILKALFFI